MPLYPWLRQIAFNRLAALHRRHVEAGKRSVGREQSLELSSASAIELAEHLTGRESGPLRRAIRKEMCQRVRSALAALPETDREILILRHLEQLSYADSAAILQISEAAAKQPHVRALRWAFATLFFRASMRLTIPARAQVVVMFASPPDHEWLSRLRVFVPLQECNHRV